MRMQLFTSNNSARSAPTTRAVRCGDHVFIGGLMPIDDEGRVIGSDITSQARVVFDSLKSILAEAGAAMTDVVKHNVYFSCAASDDAVADFIEEVDLVRADYFSIPGPTTTETRVGLDLAEALIQIDAWAIVGVPRQRLMPANHGGPSERHPFSSGWKVGDMIFVGGQRSLDEAGRVVGVGDIEVQTDIAFGKLDALLIAAGGNRNNLMRQNTYFRYFGQGPNVTEFWEKMTKVRMRYMSVPSAAGAGLRITGFPNTGEMIQVEGIGVLGDVKQRLQPANHWDWSIPGNEFTQGWRIGDLAFIGGQISADSQAKAVGNDMAAQTRNVFTFVHNVLGEAGLDESDVAKLYIYYYAPDDWVEVAKVRATITEIQEEFYPQPGPATTAIRVSGFAFEDLLIEIEAIAICRD